MANDENTPPTPPDDKGDATSEQPPKSEAQGEPVAETPPPASGVVANLGLVDALRRGFADYLETNHVQPAEGNELNVDLDFMKDHAGPLLAHLLRSATQSILPKDLKFSVQAPPPEDKPEKSPVNVNFDLGAFLSKLFNPPSTNPPR